MSRNQILDILSTAPGDDTFRPVIGKTSRGIECFGTASDHQHAALVALAQGVSCERISLARINDDDRTFYLLRSH